MLYCFLFLRALSGVHAHCTHREAAHTTPTHREHVRRAYFGLDNGLRRRWKAIAALACTRGLLFTYMGRSPFLLVVVRVFTSGNRLLLNLAAEHVALELGGGDRHI